MGYPVASWGQLKKIMRNALDDTEIWVEIQTIGDHPTIPERAHSGALDEIEFVTDSKVIFRHKD